MTNQASIPSSSFNWHRVGAFGTTLTAHAVALLLILMPVVAPPIQRSLQRSIEVSFVDPPTPPPPAPPEVEPLPKPKVVPPRATPVPPRPAPAPVAAAPVDTAPEPAPVPAPEAPDIRPTAPSQAPVGGGGETRQLAYDGALRPQYPLASIRAREQGTVLLRVLVDADGRVERVEIARGSGYPKLDAAARDAVRRGRFKPVMTAGKAAPAWGLVPIEFRLDSA